ncbi:MAG: molybdopterin cofactor-binding domain-containing protein, partial [Bauldia litoralis]
SQVTAELALDAGGRFLAMRVQSIGNMGAWLTPMGPHIQTVNILKNLPGPYRTPQLLVEARCVFTNTTPIGPYRGAGRPEGVYIRERLIDEAARETGRDPVELRRRNVIAPSELPFPAPTGQTYDSGEFETVLDRALALGDWSNFEARRAESASRGRLRGRGVSLYLEVTAPVGKEMGGLCFGPGGAVTIVTGTKDFGQGHHAAFAQIVSTVLGVPFDCIDLVQGDSARLLHGGGTGGSRSIMASGTALLAAADGVIAKGRKIASHLLEAAAEDIEFADGRFRVAGTDRSLSLNEIVIHTLAGGLPETLPQSLDSELVVDTPPSAFPNGCHVCEVEVDPGTGRVTVDRYAVIDDFGTLINPMLVEGQIHGGIAQGVGQAMSENVVYDEDGQLLTGSFMDYGLPRADDLPTFDLEFHPVPTRANALGAKGCGEAGVTGALPAIVNAIADVLARAGVPPIDMPATPERVWRALTRLPQTANDTRHNG